MSMLVPDSIEPITAYKYLVIVRALPGGPPRLVSSYFGDKQERMAWPVDAPAEADCGRDFHTDTPWRLEALRSPPADRPWGNLDVAHGDPPEVALPPGLTWYWVADPHLPPAPSCTCGIYGVSDWQKASAYRQDHRALVRLAQWGRTIPAAHGARSQFACVTGVIHSTCPSFTEEDVAREYKVPVVRAHPSLNEIEERIESLQQLADQLRGQKKAADAALRSAMQAHKRLRGKP